MKYLVAVLLAFAFISSAQAAHRHHPLPSGVPYSGRFNPDVWAGKVYDESGPWHRKVTRFGWVSGPLGPDDAGGGAGGGGGCGH